MKKYALLLVMLIMSSLTFAQTKITGNVSDATGDPVIGASIVVKGAKGSGTVSDLDGNFTVSVPNANSQLQVSYIGYITKTISLEGQKNVKVVLEEDKKTLDEVVVVGYGVQKKKLVTGSTVQVKGDDIAKLNTVDVLGALQSQSPGVNIVQINGFLGSGFKVNIRGLGTIGDSAPLYVVDG